MITISILMILMMVAVPAYKSTIEANRRATYVTELLEDLTLARSEAIKRNKRVVVCPSSSGTGCGTDRFWTNGWMIFVDLDADGLFDAGEPILRAHPALKLPTGWEAKKNGTSPYTVPFRPTGEIPGVGGAGFRICIIESTFTCDPAGVAAATRYSNIVAIAAGRLRIESK